MKRAARARTPKTVIVGYGRLGGALASGLERARWPVKVLPRSDASVRRAVKAGHALADLDALRSAQLCILAVPDSTVATVAAQLEEDLGPKAALVHCAGALDLEAFGRGASRRARGSLHPLVAVSDPRDPLAGHSAAVAASSAELLRTLKQLAGALALTPLEVSDGHRAAYHAGAVMSAGLLVALLDAACAALGTAGIGRAEAVDALVPLMRSALLGASSRGLNHGLTGPLVRGDVAVVEAHLNALPADIRGLYLRLSRRALKLAAERLPAETVRRFEALLGAD